MKVSTSLAVAAVIASAGAASAATVEFQFSFTESAYPTKSYSQTVDGLTVTVTAGSFINGFNFPSSTVKYDDDGNPVSGYIVGHDNGFDDDAYVDPDWNGLGVLNNFSNNTDDHDEVDGSNWDDFLILSFRAPVQMTYAKFGAFDSHYDDFRLFYDLSGDGTLGKDDFVTFKRSSNPFENFPVAKTDIIGVLATGSDDKWKLKKIKVEYHPEVVPLPAACWLLLAGIGGLAACGRRKRAA